MTRTTHFGFRNVAEEEKETLVRGVFDRVASRYDLMNDLMSGGLHRLWKNEMVRRLHPRSGMRILDVAGGTGDIAFRMLDAVDKKMKNPLPDPPPHAEEGIEVTICDINQQMLIEGQNRAIDRNRLQPLNWVCGNAETLPFPDASFDAYTIAFGIRNVTHIDAALREAHRVLKIGGRFLCLEFSQVKQDWLRKAYDRYSFSMIPTVGQYVTGSAEPYQYLVESIRRFPDQETFAAMIRAAGFGNVQWNNMTQGVVALHSGRKL